MDDRERELELELALRSKMQGQAGATHAESISPRAPRPASQLSDIPGGLWQGLKNVGYGALQRGAELQQMLPEGMRPAGPNVAEMMRQELIKKRAAEASAPPQSILHDVSSATGSAVPAMGLAAATGGYSIPASALTGAFSGYLKPSASPAETLTNTALEGALAGGTTAATRFFMPRNMAEPEHLKSIAAGRKEGMSYTGGQIADAPIIQRAEAHAVWNPLVKAQAIEQQNQQDNQFITAMLKQTGMPAKEIGPNPSLDPVTLKKVAQQVGERLDAPFKGKTIDVYTPKTLQALSDAEKMAAELPEEDAKIVAAEIKRATAMANNGKMPGEEVQAKLRRMLESAGRLDAGVGGRGGNKEAADTIQKLHDALLDQAIPSDAGKAAYNAARGDYARFMTIEDTLRASKTMGKGVPERGKLASVIEQNMPGGVIRDKSTMADLARGGQVSRPSSALPDRAHEFLQFQDIPNAISFARWNNPLAKQGLLHPGVRDAADIGRFIPGSYAAQQYAPQFAPGLFGHDFEGK